MALKDAITTVLNRNAFYRDGYRLLLRLSIIQGIVIVVLVAAIVSLFLSIQNKYIYFATTSDGRIINIVPLNDPYRSDADVTTFAEEAARDVMSFDYRNWRDTFQRASSNFTPAGWENFMKALTDSKIIDSIVAHKEVVSLVIEGAPEFTNKFSNNGVYTWYVQVPISIHFDGEHPSATIRKILLLQIVRVSTLQNPDGISIEQWVTVDPDSNNK